VENNYFINCGMKISSNTSQSINNNYINGEMIYYYINESNVDVPSDAQQVIMVNCNNFNLQNLNINSSDNAITIKKSSNISIINSVLSNNSIGISIIDSTNILIHDSFFIDNTYAGVAILNSNSLEIVNNTFYNDGIILAGLTKNLWNSHTIENNSINNKKIYYYSDENGINVPIDAGQIIIANCTNMEINNLYLNNVSVAIQLGYSSNNLIHQNTLKNNIAGVSILCNSDNNILYNNNLINKIDNALDNCSNIWFDDINNKGNFWSDFHNESHGAYDNNNDGIVDSPYNISGGDNQDLYPLTEPITIPPIANFIYAPDEPTTMDYLYFTDLSTDEDGYIDAWYWDFGDGTDSTLQHPTHQYTAAGNYTVCLTVYDNFGVSNTTCKNITVLNVADFIWTPANPTVLDIIQFNDTSNDPYNIIVNWSWDFGDGNSSYLQHPTHQYTYSGEYSVCLMVMDDNGSSDTVCKTLTVYNLPPVADFSFNPSVPQLAEDVVFTDTSTDIDGFIVNWNWLFGDGNISYNQHPTHQYMVAGNYTVWLTVMDDDGAIDTISKELRVNQPPVADFTYMPLTPTTQDTIQFTDTSTDPDGFIVSWQWDFDDGQTSTQQHPTHQYGDNGVYNVCLTIWDDDGATDTICKPITVDNVGPIADFTWTPINPTIHGPAQFTDTSTDLDGYIEAWLWDFGDGDTSPLEHPTHQYTAAGNYTVCLLVTDDDDATDTVCKSIVVTEGFETLDVNQSISDRGFPVRHALDGDWAAAQSFIPLANTLTKAEIYMRKFGTPEFNLTVQLRENHPQGTLVDTLIFTPAEVPGSWNWFTLDFTDTPITPGIQYFIVCPPAPLGVTTSFGYEWGYAFGNQYDDGSFWFTRDGGGLWRDLPTMYEFTFRTYGYS